MSKDITLVTGGSSGLGLEIARCYLIAGKNVCIVGRNRERLDCAVKSLSESGISGELLALQCNVAIEDEVASVFSEILKCGFVLKNVYNVAGIGLYCEPSCVTRDMIDKLLEGNFIGLLIVSTHALRVMKDSGGTIVNVLSSAAKRANSMEAAYCGVKWGARGYTESLAANLKGSNVRVLAVYPGGMDTQFWKGEIGLSPNVSRFMNPKEVAEAIVSVVWSRKSLKVTELSLERN